MLSEDVLEIRNEIKSTNENLKPSERIRQIAYEMYKEHVPPIHGDILAIAQFLDEQYEEKQKNKATE